LSAAKLLFVGLSESLKNDIRARFKEPVEIVCESLAHLDEAGKGGILAGVHLIFVGPSLDDAGNNVGDSAGKALKSVRVHLPEAPAYYVTEVAAHFDREQIREIGYLDAFLLPLDGHVLERLIAREALDPGRRGFSPVRLVDIEPGARLPFQVSVYLNTMAMYYTIAAPGEVLDAERVDKLKKRNVSNVYVPCEQLHLFYSYSANRLKELASGSGNMTETERKERMRESVRGLITGMLSESFTKDPGESGKMMVHAQEIVHEYIMVNDKSDWYDRLMREIGQRGDTYTHISSVATYSVLFSLLLGIEGPAELATAGMFHDLGLSRLPAEVQRKDASAFTPEEVTIHRQHPVLSIEMIQAKRIQVSDRVLQAIRQHHEKWDGTGFPEGLKEDAVCVEAQLLGFADRFDYLTSAENSIAPMTPAQAIRVLEAEGIMNPRWVGELKTLFTQAAEEATRHAS